MNVFNTETNLMSNPLNFKNIPNELKKEQKRYIENDIYNVILVSQAIPKFYISESLKLGLSAQRGYNSAMIKRNLFETVVSTNKWVLFDKKTGITRSIRSSDLDEKSKKFILDRLNEIEEKNYKGKNPRKIKTNLSIAMNRPTFLDTVSNETQKGVKIINLENDKTLILRKDAERILGYTIQPETSKSSEEEGTPIVEEIDDDIVTFHE